MKVTFVFFHPILREAPFVVEMASPPVVGDLCTYQGQNYRVASRGFVLSDVASDRVEANVVCQAC